MRRLLYPSIKLPDLIRAALARCSVSSFPSALARAKTVSFTSRERGERLLELALLFLFFGLSSDTGPPAGVWLMFLNARDGECLILNYLP